MTTPLCRHLVGGGRGCFDIPGVAPHTINILSLHRGGRGVAAGTWARDPPSLLPGWAAGERPSLPVPPRPSPSLPVGAQSARPGPARFSHIPRRRLSALPSAAAAAAAAAIRSRSPDLRVSPP